MVISARIIKHGRRMRYCSDCGDVIRGLFISAYGMADAGDQPFTVRFHPGCCAHSKDEKIVLAKAAAAHLLAHPDWTIEYAFAAANGRCEV